MRLGIRGKLITVLLLVAVSSIVLVGGRAYLVAKQVVENRIGQGLKRQAISLMTQLDRMLYERYQNLHTWSQDEIMIGILNDDRGDRISNFLKAIKKEYGVFSELILADNTGKIIAASKSKLKGKSVVSQDWYADALDRGSITTDSIGTSPFTGNYVITFAAPIKADLLLRKSQELSKQGLIQEDLLATLETWKPEFLGVLTAYINWSEVIDVVNMMPILEHEEQNEDAYAILINREGLALTQPFFENEAIMLHENLKEKGIEAAHIATLGESGFTLEAGRMQRQDIIGYAASKGFEDFKGLDWAVLVFQSSTEALAPIELLRVQISGIGLAVALLAAMLSLLISRNMTHALSKLVAFSRSIAKGDFSGNVAVKSNDEFGDLASSFNDMTKDLAKAKNDLVDAMGYADNIVKSALDTLLVTDLKGIIKNANPAIKTSLGYEPSEVEGKAISELVSGERLNQEELMASMLTKGFMSAEMDFKHKDESLIPMLVTASSMKDTSGGLQGIVIFAKDVREFKSLEEQFHRAQRMDAVGRLAGGIAHDFNNMLTVINGYSEKILRKASKQAEVDPNAPKANDVAQILKAGQRAAGLVRQLLTFSRRQVVEAQVTNLNDLVTGMNKMFRHMMGDHVEVVCLPGDDVWNIKVDPGHFEQVLANLAVNARDAMPGGGKLIMKTSNFTIDKYYASHHTGMKTGEFALLEVSDTGTGMPEEVKKKIFEPFFTTKGKDKGTGLGLATCYGMVKQAGGYIQVDSVEGKGTTFKIFLPKVEGEAVSVHEDEVSKELPRGDETVLLVEDEQLVQDLAKSLLEDQGYKVYVANNGSEALRVSEEHQNEKIHLLLTDVVMPKMGGRELVERMGKIRPDMRVVIMSGYADDDSVHSQVKENTIAFIPKPITPSVLANKVREVLDEKKKAA